MSRRRRVAEARTAVRAGARDRGVAGALGAGQDRQHPARQGGDAGAGGAGVRWSASPPSSSWRAARRSACSRASASACVLAQPLGGVAAGRGAGRAPDPRLGGAPPRFRRLAAARAAGAAVRRRGGGARHRGGVLRRRVLPFRHPGLVQRSGPPGGDRVAAGLARLPGRAPRQYPLGRAGNGQRPDARRPVPDRRSVGVRRGAGHADDAARPHRGGDLRSADPAGARRGRPVRRHGRSSCRPRTSRRRRWAATWSCWPPATARACRPWCGSIRRRR